eukprot:Nitzschia sp. Nitz4//scaffold133_size116822//52446//53393//NITZ4_003805-RA/size116822-processed-gene-0.59-mRNA-1//-1//CDS//3329535390//8840//frame0
MSFKTIAAALDATALRFPSQTAILSPTQSYTYEQVSQLSNALAGFLKLYGFDRKDYLVSDLGNTPENLLVQFACNRIGVYYATATELEQMAKFPKVRGAIATHSTGFLAETNLPLPYLSGEFLQDLLTGSGGGIVIDDFDMEEHIQELVDGSDQQPHAYYHGSRNSNSGSGSGSAAYTNQQALQEGAVAADTLCLVEQDVIGVATNLSSSFGFGSAVCAALHRGSCLALPPALEQGQQQQQEEDDTWSPDALEHMFNVLETNQCTLLVGDQEVIGALPDHPLRLNLRGGLCKVGPGSEWLETPYKYAGVSFRTMG